MEKTFKVSTTNIENKKIVKEIPESLYPQYISMGWKDEKQKETSNNFEEIIDTNYNISKKSFKSNNERNKSNSF